MVLSGRRFLHKVNMAVRGPMEIINKDEASPCEICQRLQQKSLSSLYRDDLCFLFHYLHCLTESRQKSRVLCAVFVLFFLFYAVFIEHQINTILYGKPTVGSCTGFAESKLPSYENFRFCLCGGKKKKMA